MNKITSGEDLYDFLYEDQNIIDFYKKDILYNYTQQYIARTYPDCDKWNDEQWTQKVNAILDKREITLEEILDKCENHLSRVLTVGLYQEYEATVMSIIYFVFDHKVECTEKINDKKLIDYLTDNVTLNPSSSTKFFEHILHKINAHL